MKVVSLWLASAMLTASSGIASADCQCRANGQMFHHGQVACLTLPSGKFIARCEMVLNNSSWTKLQDGCPEVLSLPFVSPLEKEKAAQPPPLGHGGVERRAT